MVVGPRSSGKLNPATKAYFPSGVTTTERGLRTLNESVGEVIPKEATSYRFVTLLVERSMSPMAPEDVPPYR